MGWKETVVNEQANKDDNRLSSVVQPKYPEKSPNASSSGLMPGSKWCL
jgi:hypothetical protein